MEKSVILQNLLHKFQEAREAVNTASLDELAAEAQLERIQNELYTLALEVSLTPMPTLPGLSCKARYLLEYVGRAGGDIGAELARSLATDVLAVTKRANGAH